MKGRNQKVMQLTGFEGKNALVTGASRGMGKAIAKVLAMSGAQVICCAKNQEVLVQTCSEIKKGGGRSNTGQG
jgi:NAD(P)-dependent dehydrogenase (short-subunit alcohol dehydrogenase family)